MINNTAVDNKHPTEANIDTVYPITFSGATDSGGLPMFKVTLTYADGSSKELEYNVDYKLVYDDVQENNNESFNKPHLNGIKFLLPEYAVEGNTLYILRTTPFEQPVDFQIGRIDPEQIEKIADLSVLRDQELDNKIKKLRKDVVDEFIVTDSRFDSIQEQKADKAELSNYLPLTGGTLLGKVLFDISGTAGKNTQLISVKTASGTVPLVGAKTDDNGVLRDIAVIPNLQSTTFQSTNLFSSFIGSTTNPVTRIHAKKIGTGLISELLTIPDEGGTIARLEDIPDTYTKEEVDAKFAETPGFVETYSKAEIDAKLSSVYKFKGSVANVEALPTDAVVGDVYNVEDTGANYAWDGSNWDKLSDTVDLSNYLPTTGGTLTGSLFFEPRTGDAFEIRPTAYGNLEFRIRGLQIVDIERGTGLVPDGIGTYSLGGGGRVWKNVYTQKLNNGEDLIVPTEGGTLARLEDLEGIDALPDQSGNAGKVLMTDGSKASWQEAPAGGTKVIIKRYN